MKKLLFQIALITTLAVIFLAVFIKFTNVSYLVFSDSAKFADIARSIVSGIGFKGTFSFWSSGIADLSQRAAFPSPWVPPLMPYSIALFSKFFGISDFSVIATSSFYFVLLVVITFLLGNKLYGKLGGVLSSIAVLSSVDFLNYATQGATEPIFAFEIVAGAYFISLKKKWAMVVAVLFMVLMYFTRPQAFIYIAGLIFYWLLLNFKIKKAIFAFIGILIFGFLIDRYIMPHFAGNYFLYSVTGRGFGTVTNVLPGGSASQSLRGESVEIAAGLTLVFKKVFYNLYNFYKLMPQIMNPYLFTLFVIGIFIWSKDRVLNSFKIASIVMVAKTLLVTAESIPVFRYIHPVIPLV